MKEKEMVRWMNGGMDGRKRGEEEGKRRIIV